MSGLVTVVATFCKGFRQHAARGDPPWGRLEADARRLLALARGAALVLDRGTSEARADEVAAAVAAADMVVVVDPDGALEVRNAHGAWRRVAGALEQLMDAHADAPFVVLGGPALDFVQRAPRRLRTRRTRLALTSVDRAYEEAALTAFPPPPAHLWRLEPGGCSAHVEGGVAFRHLQYERIGEHHERESEHERENERGYLDLMARVALDGEPRADRTGTGTRALFGRQLRFDLRGGQLPMVTTRLTSFKMVAAELLWFLRGDTDARRLRDQGVRIWEGNTSREFLDARGLGDLAVGDIGAGYGFQWRHFGAEYRGCRADHAGQGVDQLAEVERLIREEPASRRICLTGWNPAALGRMALPPCHSCFVQFFVGLPGGAGEGVPGARRPMLSCHMTQRSADCFLGLAANIPSYALLTHLLAARAGLEARELIISTGDTHVYADHLEQVAQQAARVPLPPPVLRVSPAVRGKAWEQIALEDFELVGYLHHPPIRGAMSV